MEINKIKEKIIYFRKELLMLFALALFTLVIIAILVSIRTYGLESTDKKGQTDEDYVANTVSNYIIIQTFSTKASDFSKDKEWLDGWRETGYFGAVNTLITKKSTGDTISGVACIVRKKYHLVSVKQDMYDEAVDIIEATEEFDNIKID